ncbi:VWA domain-containing protein [Bacillota bacterium LX-D]|nr:VWA domain-containing protein [Bacillota bacterium LX-D]
MVKSIVSFARYLRKAGFSISTIEIMDCIEALSLVEFDVKVFEQVLRCSFVKSQEEADLFHKLFTVYFHLMKYSLPEQTNGQIKSPLDNLTPSEKRASNTDGRGVGQSGIGGPSLLQAFLNKDYGLIRKIITAQISLLDLNNSEVVPQTIADYLRQIQLNLDWFMLENQLLKQSQEDTRKKEYYNDLLKKVKLQIETELIKHLSEKLDADFLTAYAEASNYKNTEFGKLSQEQYALIQKQIIKLGKRLAIKDGRRSKDARQGDFSFKSTIRKAFSTGGKVLKIVNRKRKPGKPELLVLCDVSNSVAQFSQFFLLLVFAVQKRFSAVHTLIFVDRLEDITNFILRNDFTEVANKALFNTKISASGFSDFGRVFNDISTDYVNLLKHNTTVIILGDAKNNWREPKVEALKFIADKCAKVYWLNPKDQSSWYQEDSILELYEPYVNKVYQCSNLKQLYTIANKIL